MTGGDLDKDGTDDLLVGSPYDYQLDTLIGGAANTSYTGAVFVFYGSTSGGLDQNRYAKLLVTPQYSPQVLAAEYAPGTPPAQFASGTDPWYTTSRYLAAPSWLAQGDLSRAYDVNGDGIADFIVGAGRETTGTHPTNYLGGVAYLIYGINGGYASLGPSVCAPIGGPGPYPCTVQLLNLGVGAASDYQPNHIATNVNNSCYPATNFCNALRFYPYGMGYYRVGLRRRPHGPGRHHGRRVRRLRGGQLADVGRPRLSLYLLGLPERAPGGQHSDLPASLRRRRLHSLLHDSPHDQAAFVPTNSA